ncbi:hypothetical protein NC652_017067 [Populus alba x Populus x berolinensis]|nr:hypothetical protein NC652_017067 [Populus alba x Populus x berolinensis]
MHLNIDTRRSGAACTLRDQISVNTPQYRLRLQLHLLPTAFSPPELQRPSSNQKLQEPASNESNSGHCVRI